MRQQHQKVEDLILEFTRRNKNQLFSEFPAVSAKQWRAQIEKDLKGADFDKKLLWKSIEGFDVQPYYRAEDLTETIRENSQILQKKHNDWKIRQNIRVKELEKARLQALELLQKGVNSLHFEIDPDDFPADYFTPERFSALLEGIELQHVEVNFSAKKLSFEVLQLFANEVQKRQLNTDEITGGISFSPLGYYILNGQSPIGDVARCFKLQQKMIEFAEKNLPNYKIFTIDGGLFANSGGSIVQELAFGLSMANEYLTQMLERGLTIDQVSKHLRFDLSIGSNYFMEIAKFRAIRILWHQLISAYQPEEESSTKIYVHAQTSTWNKTIADTHVNMLRTSTEAMSAALGNVDSLEVLAFDSMYEADSEFADRIARNQQLLLKEESHLDRVVDPAAGSYYIEQLTQSIGEHAWALFQEVEAEGGFLQAFNDGLIQKRIESMAEKRNLQISTQKAILLGTNQYPNPDDRLSDKMPENTKNTANESPVRPLQPYRAAEMFEAMRSRTEQMPKRPKVFLLTYGDLSIRKARASFSSNFFACAGFEIINNLGFETPEAGIEAFRASQADILVLCSTDKAYETLAPSVFDTVGNETILVVAGYPKAIVDLLQSKGIQHFIHTKSNILEKLNEFQNALLS